MRRRKLITSALAVALLGGMAGFSVHAESGYYKWKDQYGNPNHGDRPPPAGVEYEFVSTDTGLKRKVTAEESRAAAAETGAVAGSPAATPQQTASSEATPAPEKNPVYCEQARKNLASLDTSARIRMKDPEGKLRYLTAEEKEAQREKALDLIAVHCEDS